MSEQDGPSFTPEVDSEEEWEAEWEEFARLARKYGWPEKAVQSYLTDKVSYQERLKSLGKARDLWQAGHLRDALIENKRTKLKTPMDPAEVRKIHEMFQRGKKVNKDKENGRVA